MFTELREPIQLDPTKRGGRTDHFEQSLRRLVVGQPEAIQDIVNIYQTQLAGMNPPGRPIGNFLFLGPTGTGKTRIVEATADVLYNNPRAVIKIDCAEFQHSHEVAKLIGSPPGYLGHRETHPLLSQEVLNQYHTDRCRISLLLFDEIEKASDALWKIMLGIMDKATLTLGSNQKVDFAKVMIFMTSNLGAKEMSNILSPKLGFGLGRFGTQNSVSDASTSAKIRRSGHNAIAKKFTPEFMNRLDKVVIFRPLDEAQLREVLDLELQQVQRRIFAAFADRSFVFEVSQAAKQFILEQGTNIQYGARHLKRSIERLLVQPLSNLVATDQVYPGDLINVGYLGDNLTFHITQRNLSPATMVQCADGGSLQRVATASSFGDSRSQVSSTSRRS